MPTGILFNSDALVAHYIFNVCGLRPISKFDSALGVISEDGNLNGAVLFHYWNGANVELSYYGENTLTPGIVRCLARYTLINFEGISRATVTTSRRNKRLIKALKRLGFKYESSQRRFYGNEDSDKNTGIKLVIFVERIRELARFPKEDFKDVHKHPSGGNTKLGHLNGARAIAPTYRFTSGAVR